MQLIINNITFNTNETSKLLPVLKNVLEYSLYFKTQTASQQIICSMPTKVVIEGTTNEATRPFNYSNYNIQIELDCYEDYKDHSIIKFDKNIIRFNLNQNLTDIDNVNPTMLQTKTIDIKMERYAHTKYSVLPSSSIQDSDIDDLRRDRWTIINISKQNIPPNNNHFDVKFELIR